MGEAGLKRSTRTADQPFDRFGRNVEDVGDFEVAQSLMMFEDDGRFLIGGKSGERGVEVSGALLFDESLPGRGGGVRHIAHVVCGCDGEVSLASAVNAQANQHAIEIRAKGRRRFIAWGCTENVEKSLLGNVLGLHCITEEPVSQPPGGELVAQDELVKRFEIATAERLHELFVSDLCHNPVRCTSFPMSASRLVEETRAL